MNVNCRSNFRVKKAPEKMPSTEKIQLSLPARIFSLILRSDRRRNLPIGGISFWPLLVIECLKTQDEGTCPQGSWHKIPVQFDLDTENCHIWKEIPFPAPIFGIHANFLNFEYLVGLSETSSFVAIKFYISQLIGPISSISSTYCTGF